MTFLGSDNTLTALSAASYQQIHREREQWILDNGGTALPADDAVNRDVADVDVDNDDDMAQFGVDVAIAREKHAMQARLTFQRRQQRAKDAYNAQMRWNSTITSSSAARAPEQQLQCNTSSIKHENTEPHVWPVQSIAWSHSDERSPLLASSVPPPPPPLHLQDGGGFMTASRDAKFHEPLSLSPRASQTFAPESWDLYDHSSAAARNVLLASMDDEMTSAATETSITDTVMAAL